MTDSSEDEDLSRFREAVDNSFTKVFDKASGKEKKSENIANNSVDSSIKSERYLEVSGHYNDVKVPDATQRKIGKKVSDIINKNIEFVKVENSVKKRKIKGGVRLFKESTDYLTTEELVDTYTDTHNAEAKKKKNKRKNVDDIDEKDKISSVVLTGDYILSKEETKCWKSRRKEKLFKYKSKGKSNVLTIVEE